MFLSNLRRKAELGEQLALNAMAAQGESRTINKQIRELVRDAT